MQDADHLDPPVRHAEGHEVPSDRVFQIPATNIDRAALFLTRGEGETDVADAVSIAVRLIEPPMIRRVVPDRVDVCKLQQMRS